MCIVSASSIISVSSKYIYDISDMMSLINYTRSDVICYGVEISLSMSCPLAELPLGALPRVLLAEISEMSGVS